MRSVKPEQDTHGLGAGSVRYSNSECYSNAHRNVVRRMSKKSRHAEPYATDIPMWDITTGKKITAEVYFMLPSEEVDALYADIPPQELCTPPMHNRK